MRAFSEVVDRLYEEAERVGLRANHEREQGNDDFAVCLAQVEFGLYLVAHVFEAVLVDEVEE